MCLLWLQRMNKKKKNSKKINLWLTHKTREKSHCSKCRPWLIQRVSQALPLLSCPSQTLFDKLIPCSFNAQVKTRLVEGQTGHFFMEGLTRYIFPWQLSLVMCWDWYWLQAVLPPEMAKYAGHPPWSHGEEVPSPQPSFGDTEWAHSFAHTHPSSMVWT